MNHELDKIPSSVLYLSHGGGTLPLLGDKGHQNLINFIREITVQKLTVTMSDLSRLLTRAFPDTCR